MIFLENHPESWFLVTITRLGSNKEFVFALLCSQFLFLDLEKQIIQKKTTSSSSSSVLWLIIVCSLLSVPVFLVYWHSVPGYEPNVFLVFYFLT